MGEPEQARRGALRAAFRRRRRALAPERQRRHAASAMRTLLPRLDPAARVAAYLARDGEVDLGPLIDTCWRRGIAVALPVLDGDAMFFAAYQPDERLRPGEFGIPQPERPVPVEPTVVLAPLVAFDAQGNRLGMGGGFYDRYLAAHPDALAVGVAHECQRTDALPTHSRDVPLAAVVTERGWQTFPAHPQ